MKAKRFTEEQIIGILKQAEAGMKIIDLCRMHGISDATFYTWRKKYGGIDVSDARIHQQSNGCMGPREQRKTAIHSAGKAGAECVHRKFQRQTA